MYMCKDDDSTDDVNELNAQLFAAARTNELLTSLRLLERILNIFLTSSKISGYLQSSAKI